MTSDIENNSKSSLEIYDMFYRVPNYYNADDNDYQEHKDMMRAGL